ncbi:MAG: hypothetical protein ACTSWI_02075 [Alphaproteobacteria bacterium]
MTMGGDFVPGPCNIGADEIRCRRLAGWVGTAETGTVWLRLAVSDAPPARHLIIFVPALVEAAGFLQAAIRYCFHFGFSGVFNFERVGQRERIADPEALRPDRATASRVLAISCAIAGVVALAAYGGAFVLG